jgi:hypothetical protein
MSETTLDELRAFCQFLGWSRSGTSLVGSLLNAHPRVVIAHELDASARIGGGASRERVLAEILAREAGFARGGRIWNGYSYAVSGAGQDESERPLVLGDKKAGGTAEALMQRPGLLGETEELLGVPLLLVTVVRNPFDVVATLSRHLDDDLPPWAERPGGPVTTAIDWYVRIAEVVAGVLAERPGRIRLVHLEQLIADPRGELRSLFEFLEVGADERTIDACAEIVFERPHQSGEDLAGADAAGRARLEAALERYEFLAPYRPGTLA